MAKYIYRKKQILHQMGVLEKLSAEEMQRLQTARNEIAVDNIARSLINKYL